MKYGARNNIQAKVTSIQKGDVMSLVKFEVVLPAQKKACWRAAALIGIPRVID